MTEVLKAIEMLMATFKLHLGSGGHFSQCTLV
jgi:hypothetical protein